MSELRIITNNQPRLLLDWNQLTPSEQADFDYLSEEDRIGRDFVRYRGSCYDLGEFESVERGFGTIEPNEALKGWHGYHCDSYFSAVLVRYLSNDSDYVVMGLALS